jgi:parallel beta-helix repeat protein
MIILASISFAASKIQRVETPETIYIRADGSVEGTTSIQTADNVTYVFNADIINNSIVVERDNIVIDGNGYALLGDVRAIWSEGIALSGRSNITIKSIQIENFWVGIYLNSSSSNIISGNNITNNSYCGMQLNSSSSNTISGNNITNNWNGIYLYSSSNYNSISENNITANMNHGILLSSSNNTMSENNIASNGSEGIHLDSSSSNSIYGNNITNSNGIALNRSSSNSISENNIADNWNGIYLYSSFNNSINGNNITNNRLQGIELDFSSNNNISGNNFINNANQAALYGTSINTWDSGYPSGGNYWSDYLARYPNATEIDDVGIGDMAYVIDANNTDNYPLMTQYVIPEFPSSLILPLFMIATLLAVIVYKKTIVKVERLQRCRT